MSGTACCYKGCQKSYSQDRDVTFFRFPDDPKRRKRWMDNCGIQELHALNERQLRLKRVCADHFSPLSFNSQETRNQLTEKAVPYSQKEAEAAAKAAEEAQKEQALNPPKRGRGRPSKFSLILVKKEEDLEDDSEEDEEEEDDPSENGDDDADYENAPPTLRKQSSNSDSKGKTSVKPPKLTAVKLKAGGTPKARILKVDADRRISGSVKRMADLSVIDDVVNEMSLGVDISKTKKRQSIVGPDERILSKRLKSAGFVDPDDLINSDEELSDMEDSDDEEEEEEGMAKSNREFEMFQEGLRKVIKLPVKWGMGGVVWDPLNKMKVIAISEVNVQRNGIVQLLRSIQMFEDSTVKVTIDSVDMTLNFGIQSIEVEEDVNKIIKIVAEARVCVGVKNFQPDDIIYLPEARKRGCVYYSDACPVILDETVKGSFCNPCIELQKALITRKEKERAEMATRKLRVVSKNLKNDFGRALYGLLNEILDDSNALKSDRKQDREAVLSKYSTELGVMNGEIQKPEKIPQVHISVDEVSASFQDIVARLGFSKNKKPGQMGMSFSQPIRTQPIDDHRASFASKSFLSKFTSSITTSASNTYTQRSSYPMTTSIPVSTSGSSTSFSLADGQTYEILGEVGGSEVVQGSKGEAIEIIEVDDETMAKLTAQNSGMFQNSTPGSIQMLDTSDPGISQLLKAINPSQA